MIGYSLTLPLGPSDNSYYGSNGNRRYIKPAGLAFRQEVALAVKQSKMPKLKGRLCVIARIYPKTKALTDVANRAKALCDALMLAGAFEDDSQIDDIQFIRGPVVTGGRCEVMIGELSVQK